MKIENVTSLFALEFKGELVGVTIHSNDGAAFCGDTTVILDEYSNNIWVTHDREIAERVMRESTEWYNSGMSSPQHGCGMTGNLTIVEFKR